jgi:hypothetical protein
MEKNDNLANEIRIYCTEFTDWILTLYKFKLEDGKFKNSVGEEMNSQQLYESYQAHLKQESLYKTELEFWAYKCAKGKSPITELFIEKHMPYNVEPSNLDPHAEVILRLLEEYRIWLSSIKNEANKNGI